MSRTRSFEHRLKHIVLGSVVTGAIIVAAGPSFAQSQTQIDRLEQEVKDLQQQIQSMREQVDTTQQ